MGWYVERRSYNQQSVITPRFLFPDNHVQSHNKKKCNRLFGNHMPPLTPPKQSLHPPSLRKHRLPPDITTRPSHHAGDHNTPTNQHPWTTTISVRATPSHSPNTSPSSHQTSPRKRKQRHHALAASKSASTLLPQSSQPAIPCALPPESLCRGKSRSASGKSGTRRLGVM